MLMILGHLFPLGVLQLGDVVTNGYWPARTEWFRNYPWLSWARMPGDVVYQVFRLGPARLADPQGGIQDPEDRRPRRTRRGPPLEATLYTEITPGRDRRAGLIRKRLDRYQ